MRTDLRSRLPLSVVSLALLLLAASAGTLALGGGRTIVPGDDPLPNPAPHDDGMEAVVIRHPPPYDALVARILAAGGEVRHAFDIVDAVSARVPRAALPALGRFAGAGSITKDPAIPKPERVISDPFVRTLPVERRRDDETIALQGVVPLDTPADIAAFAGAHPDSYSVNNGLLGVATLHATGYAGQGTVVAVIDSGLRPGFPHLQGALDDSILDGMDFARDGISWSSRLNDGHGTFVAGMISGNVLAQLPPGPFLAAVRRHAPDAIINENIMPMLGSAPLSKIFVMRVFSPFIPIPTSAILEAMEEVLYLRDAHRQGIPGGVDIGVVSMSLSTPSLDPGRDLLSAAADKLVQQGVVVVVSAGNSGPSGVTTGTPSSSYESLSVGAASLAHNERILRDLQLGGGFGRLYRPFDGPQTALFSSRGPIADGRAAPHVTASGYASMGMGFTATNVINLASGTSFSTPTVAGVAALLRQGFPQATARQIRNALVMTARPDVLADGSSASDQGAGYVQGQAAWNLLLSGGAPDAPIPPPRAVSSVAANLAGGAGLAIDTGSFVRRVGPLAPGQRAEIYYQAPPNVQAVHLTVTPIHPSPPGPQNELFGEDLILSVHSAKTGRHRTFFGDGDYLRQTFVIGSDPVGFGLATTEPGIIRITVTGDWINAGVMSADVAVAVEQAPAPVQSRTGSIAEFETITIPFDVPPGTTRLDARLSWKQGWDNIPLNDIDLTLVSPFEYPHYGAATLNVPEETILIDPPAGRWRAEIYGFEMPTREDRYKLRILIDGAILR